MKNWKTFKLITFGCRVNQAESRQTGERLAKKWHLKPVEKKIKADLVLINTCSVTHKAEREVRKEIRRVKRESPSCFLIVMGCWVDKIKSEKLRTENHDSELKIDLLINNREKDKKIDQILNQKLNKELSKKLNNGHGSFKDKYGKYKKALVKVQEGCNNFCTYCIVPYVRGRSQSRDIKGITTEIKSLARQGIEEAILTGTDIGDFQPDLVYLLKAILSKTKIKKISFGSINPKSFNQKFIDLYSISSQSVRLSNHFHIPLQSGCNTTLRRMNRKYNIEEFLAVIKKLKRKIPGLTFSTDIIVGFPGENQEEFKQTLKTLRQIKQILGKNFIKMHVFRYSPRERTVAAEKLGQKDWERVNAIEKKSRSKKVSQFLTT